MSATDITPFRFENKEIRVIDRDGDPWFVAAEVCRVLEIANSRDAVRILDPDEKNTVGITDGIQEGPGNPNVTIISEPGLYKLLGRSRKPEAKRFDRWVRHEVLPSIRKTGAYVMPDPEGELIRRTDGISRMLAKKVTSLEAVMSNLTERLDRMVITNDPRRAALTAISIRQMLDDAKALPKGRRSLNGKVRHEMLSRAALEGVTLYRCPHSGVWLFPVDFANAYLKDRGRSLIADHNAKVAGQGVLPFPKKWMGDSPIGDTTPTPTGAP